MNLKKIIAKQKALSRKIIASGKINSVDLLTISNEKSFLNSDFGNIKNVESLMEIIHTTRHNKISKAGRYTRCKLCKKIVADITQQETPLSDILPKMGNLLSILEKEALDEKANIEAMKMPSQNDLTRWALKDAVLAYYQGLNFPPDKPIVESRYDDRLIDELAPDFDIIAKIWLQKLDELQRKNDQYTLNTNEMDKAEADLSEKMQGSAFEKQLDRFREEFMAKLPR
ncbi:MAG: hypothetical protein WC523_03765 [Patescibacteria group bacterium]